MISIVIPAYNEEKRLPEYLKEIFNFISGDFKEFEIIVVDDGSEDTLSDNLRKWPEYNKTLYVVNHEKNKGKGAAVKTGMLQARGDKILFCDADGATPISQLSRLLKEYDEDVFPIVIGARVALTGYCNVDRRMSRHYLGRLFSGLITVVSKVDLYDSQCGFKLFSKKAAREIFRELESKNWAFDIEIFLLARKKGFGICEVPVSWRDIPGSKINILSDGFKMLVDVYRITERINKKYGR